MTKKIKLRWLVSTLLILVVLGALFAYITYDNLYPSTDDAYVKANVVYVSAEVSGKVSRVYVHNHQAVKRGQLLFSLNDAQYTNTVEKARANYVLSQNQIKLDQANIQTAHYKVAQANAALNVSQHKAKRMQTLLLQQQVPQETVDEAVGQANADQAALNALNADLAAAKLNAQIAKEQSKVAKADYQQALLNLQHTQVYAPVSGTLSNVHLRPGAYVNPGESLFALVDTSDFWILANFKETAIKRIKPTQSVTITLDMYPGLKLNGHIDDIDRGSGSMFSLLPPENATGNWVKVTQRFPVKVTLDRANIPQDQPLRIGASANVSVNTITHHA